MAQGMDDRGALEDNAVFESNNIYDNNKHSSQNNLLLIRNGYVYRFKYL